MRRTSLPRHPSTQNETSQTCQRCFSFDFSLPFLFCQPIWNFYCLGLICWLYMIKTFHSETRFTILVLHLGINPNLSDFRPFICDADRQRQLYSSGWQHSATLVFVLRQSKSNVAAQSRFDPPTSWSAVGLLST